MLIWYIRATTLFTHHYLVNPLKNLDILLLPWELASDEAFRIRKMVFIEEQNVPEELELDEFDALALHALVKCNDQCVGTARLVDLDNQEAQIGRMAVLKEFRNQGIGRAILEKLIHIAQERGITKMILHSQVSAIPFYEGLGFKAEGPVYDEAGIAHRNMMLILPKSPNPL